MEEKSQRQVGSMVEWSNSTPESLGPNCAVITQKYNSAITVASNCNPSEWGVPLYQRVFRVFKNAALCS